MGSLEGHRAGLPALSTSTLGVHSCPEEPAGHWHTRGRGSCPTYQPQPMQIGSGRITAGPKRFLPYSSAKITLPRKNKQKNQTLTSQHSPRPNPRQPDSHSAKEQRAANHEKQDSPSFSSCCFTGIDVPIDLRWVSQGISGLL